MITRMRQEEFLNIFREALVGKVPDSIIRDNENYYRNYINSQMNSGKTEQEVLDQLGDPRLLAKTIEESNKFANGDSSSFYQENTNTYRTQDQENDETGYKKTINVPAWLISIVAILTIALVIVVAFSLISFFAPVILAALMVTLVYSLIKAWKRRY